MLCDCYVCRLTAHLRGNLRVHVANAPPVQKSVCVPGKMQGRLLLALVATEKKAFNSGSGTPRAGVEVVGIEVVGIEVVGSEVVRIEVAGIEAAGIEVAGIEVAGIEVAGIEVVDLPPKALATSNKVTGRPRVTSARMIHEAIPSPLLTICKHER